MEEIEFELALTQLKDLVLERAISNALLAKTKSTDSSFPIVSFSYVNLTKGDVKLKNISYEDFEKTIDSLMRAFIILRIDSLNKEDYKKVNQYQIKRKELERAIDGNEYNINRTLHKVKSNNIMTKQDLLATIPKTGKKYKHLRPIAEKLVEKEEVTRFALAKCLKGEFGTSATIPKRTYYTLSQNRYDLNSKHYNKLIEHCLKTLRVKWKPFGYSIKTFNIEENSVRLVKENDTRLIEYVKKFSLMSYLQHIL